MLNTKFDEEGVPTDGIASYQTRLSMQSRRSRSLSSSTFLNTNGHGDREGLMHSYDVEDNHDGIGLSDLVEESDGGPGPTFKQSEERARITANHTKRNSR